MLPFPGTRPTAPPTTAPRGSCDRDLDQLQQLLAKPGMKAVLAQLAFPGMKAAIAQLAQQQDKSVPEIDEVSDMEQGLPPLWDIA